MYRPLPDGLTIKDSKLQGLGLFATKDFDADVVLGIVHILDKNFKILEKVKIFNNCLRSILQSFR